MAAIVPVKDQQTITADGRSTQPLIDGVVIRRQAPAEDERGEICEIFQPSWSVQPLVYVYQATIRPHKIKGWIVHYKQDDRIFLSAGAVRIALFDARADSPTHERLNVFTITERNRALVSIPRGVYHALQNIGETEAVFVNMPTEPYNYADPDKHRLPLKNDLIPFSFEDRPGW